MLRIWWWNLLCFVFLAWTSQSSIRHLLPWTCCWMLSWFLLQIRPNPGCHCLRLAHWASSVCIFLLHLPWDKLGLLWSYHPFYWLCCSWGIVWFPSTSLRISFSHHQTTLGLVPYSSAILPRRSCWLLQLLVLVFLTFLCLLVRICLLRLLHWSVEIPVILTMPLYCLFFLNSSCLPVVCTTYVSFLDR